MNIYGDKVSNRDKQKLNVLIVEPCRYTRRGISCLISESKPDINFITSVSDLSRATELLEETPIDIIFMHVSQGDFFSFYFDSIDFTRSIKEKNKNTKILAYTDKLTPLFQLHSAADEFVSARESLSAWRNRIATFLQMPYMDYKYLDREQESLRITKEEWDVLIKIKEGVKMKEISTSMDIKYKSVSALKNKAMRKLGLKNKNELLLFIAGM